jgi:hypothetical protein
MNIAFGIYIILLIVTIILHYSVYTWTVELKKIGCKCSEGTTRDILNVLAIIFLLLIPYRMVNYKNKYFTQFFYRFLGLISIIYFILIIYYTSKLNIEACECSDNWKKEYSLIVSIIFCILILFLLTLKIVLFSILDNK